VSSEIMQGCEEARLLASRELDRELDAAGQERLHAHLATCAPCRDERAALGRIDATIALAFTDHGFDEKLVRDVVRMAEARKPASVTAAAPRGAIIKFRAGGLVAAAAAAIILLSVGIGLWGDTTTSQPGPAAPQRAVLARAYGAALRVKGKLAEGPGDRPVVEGDTVSNDDGAGTLLLDDGTRIDLRPGTALSLRREQDGGVTAAIAGTGEVFCEVAKQKEHTFRVETRSLSATVVGTRFLVRETDAMASVAVLEGRVRVRAGQDERLLSRDQEAVRAPHEPILVARPLADARAQVSWNKRVLDTIPAAPAPQPERAAPPRPASQPQQQPGQPGMDEPVGPPRQK
jgi:ferric-dicitrate binding protein FerR (iron transport regulator)